MELVGYLESDKERILQSLREAGTPEEAQKVIESEIDRLLLRHNEDCGSERERDAALHMLQTAKYSFAVITANAEPRIWERGDIAAGADRKKFSMTGTGWALLVGSAALAVCALIMLSVLAGGALTPVMLLKALPAALAGCALMFFAGRSSLGRKDIGKGIGNDSSSRMIELRVDPDKIWNCLRSVVMVIDRNLVSVQESTSLEQRKERIRSGPGITGEETALLSGLLELAYSQPSQMSQEMIDDIRFYLHGKSIKLEDYTPENRKDHKDWFERLPGASGKDMTLRPALVQDGKLLRKGMATDAG